jgi:hypothetical protein
MKKTSSILAVICFIGLGAACTFDFPYETLAEPDNVRVTMQVVPDDADVWLNGGLIGSAYEFSTPRSALRLASLQNELLFTKKGFSEERIDLSSYSDRNIVLRIEMKAAEPRSNGVIIPRPPAITGGTLTPGTAHADEAQTEPLVPLPAEKPEEGEVPFLTSIVLTVAPAETAIYIDGKFWGLAPETGKIENLRLRPRKYEIQAFKPGFNVFKKEFVVPKAEKFSISFALQK